ncbi:MAG: RES family NAD+ phosphorylase [Firmicutes bacterium]|nr:RES family NAD+ phosphorylase [Bacillota bacterium]
MNCCVRCFNDAEIIDIIKANKTKGNCDFCGSKGNLVYPLGKETILTDMFGELLDIYTVADKLPHTFPKDNTDLLKNILYRKWSIFNVEPDCIYRLITAICYEKYAVQPDLFDNPIGVLESQDSNYLNEHSIISGYAWNDFVEAIKEINRFHTDHINKSVLDMFIRCVRKHYKAGRIFYRARICSNEIGFTKNEMGAPPAHLATAGRVNPVGISVLYLADSIKTTLHEIRAGVFDYVTVGNFKLKKDIEVIDFASLDKISPFIANDALGISYTQHAVNIEHLKLISQQIAKPLRGHDSVLDYLPTQYISDYIKSQGFDGVEYISTMCEDGFNLAVFDEKLFRCTKTTVYDIQSLSYTYGELKV